MTILLSREVVVVALRRVALNKKKRSAEALPLFAGREASATEPGDG
jgi:hypothetical protein